MSTSVPDPTGQRKHNASTAEHNSQHEGACSPTQVAIVSQVPPTPHTESKAGDGTKTPRWKIVLEFFALFLAVVVAGIYGGQLWVMNRQLGEMKSSGDQTDRLLGLYGKQLEQITKQADDTHDLALAARDEATASQAIATQAITQASETTSLAKATQREADQTRVLAENAGKQADASRTIAERTTAQADATNRLAIAADKSATESAQQLAILQRQLEVSQRAWITIRNVKAEGVRTFDKRNGISINQVITFQNVGNLPATEIHVEPFMYFADTSPSIIPLPQAIRNQQDTCIRGFPEPKTFHFSISQTAFPTVSKDFHFGAGIPLNYPNEVSAGGRIEPMLVGCIYYKFSSSDRVHETGFIYQVMRRKPDGALVNLRLGEDVPADEIVFADYWDGEAVSTNP